MSKLQLLDLLGELAEGYALANGTTEAVLALARTGKPIDARTLDKLIDLLAAHHLRAATIFGVGWPQLFPHDSPLRAEISKRLHLCPKPTAGGPRWT